MQEEVIFICGGASKPAIGQIDEIKQSFKTSYIIGADRGALSLIEAGYHLDEAIGDFDSVTAEELEMIHHGSRKVTQLQAEKDDTDMEIGLLHALAHNEEAYIYIFGGLGQTQGRMDHLIANLYLVYQPRFKSCINRLVFVEENNRVSFFSEGTYQLRHHSTFKYISIVSMSEVKDLSISNAKYELPATHFDYPRALISNEFMKGQPIELSFSQGMVMVIYTND
ncbi:thiamine diphosphokinase [Fundicoccus sp. Sow4_H7]|uniref:thiamine diphosphokinase n=1 Tax=Fundicoccus sp. Sow4_H7 TaxID=3438784 RepID=UPI003F92C1E5